MFPDVPFTSAHAYRLLKDHALKMREIPVLQLFDADPARFDAMHVRFEDILFDYSKNRMQAETLALLLDLAEETKLHEAIEAMFTGEHINKTEDRAVLHTALRNLSGTPVFDDGKDVMPEVFEVLHKMEIFSEDVISGRRKGYSGLAFTDVVNIGIGGSDLGPEMVSDALRHYGNHLRLHFVSNVDGTDIVETLRRLDPRTTIFLIASKTFTTLETMANAHTARAWFLEAAGDIKYIRDHFVALSTAEEEVKKFGIPRENMFGFWDWVGGRYSVWSAIGLSVCLGIGFRQFREFLAGAHSIDVHFRETPFEKNIPVLMALSGIWNIDFLGYPSQAIIPYDQYLHRFPAYFQQGDMESNGKYVDRNGKPVGYTTGPLIWGEPGTNGQHAFFQLLHQGSHIIPVDFIVPAETLNPVGEHHTLLLANCFAQSEALMRGKTEAEVKEELRKRGMQEEEVERQAPFRVFEGNRPGNTILLKRITPYSLGSLIALYEHKIFVQGVIWNIYSFDQWGVELGKKLALRIIPELTQAGPVTGHDTSTNGLINVCREMREK